MNDLSLSMFWILFLLGVLALGSVVLVWTMLRRRRLSASVRVRLESAWRHVEQRTDAHRRVLDAEKILDESLGALGFTGSFGEKLKKAGPRFTDTEAVWRAHKLRNIIAHDVGAAISEAEAARAISAFRKAFEEL